LERRNPRRGERNLRNQIQNKETFGSKSLQKIKNQKITTEIHASNTPSTRINEPE
jgi:hypothetical protein